ncbi:hypothetical protein IQ22_03153 [Pseudomonas duriflava]|uniref:Uncharacterized protein n=2 Tax=Pseudomonas duriflava TaxID=459528 RepID=A0A562Q7Q1_9PSED|nr:hypothetical protein IQ22_03153 [Pseudomonas duriflava]
MALHRHSRAKVLISQGLAPLECTFTSRTLDGSIRFVVFDKRGRKVYESDAIQPAVYGNNRALHHFVSETRESIKALGYELGAWKNQLSLELIGSWTSTDRHF